ncbi:MAG: DUF1385 domain-containing protein [Oscillospiraceae bacterium]|nr:DUF1385 domain-containing protein [Oscillospiraceae bacterium]
MAKKESQGFRTSIGGSALIEGILMRGVDKQSIVVRQQDGTMATTVGPLNQLKDKHPFCGWPLIRGVVNFVDSMVKSMKALTYSAQFLPEEEQEEPSKLDLWIEEKFGSEKAEKFVIGLAMVLGVALAIGLFIVLPTALVSLIPALRSGHDGLRTLLEGVVKLAILLIYMAAVAQMKDIKRVFSYHGAEHKSIFCYEHGKELTVENVREESRFHPRCGTSFLLVVIIMSILVFILVNAFLHVDNALLRMVVKICLLPVVVALTYELNRWVGRHDNLLSRILSWPGKQLQHITTNEPDDSMIEVAITALKLVIPEEKGSDAW